MQSTTTECSSARSWALSRIEAGEPVSHVACDLGVHRDTLRRWRHEDGARPRPRRSSDERARLRADAVSMLREGMRPTDVARELGVCRPDVQRWAREEGLRQIDRLRQTVVALEQRATAAEQRAAAAPTAPPSNKRTSPGSAPRTEEERLRLKIAELRKVQERTAQELRDQRKRSPWERITWALGMELGEVLPLTVMDALLAGETVRATFTHPRVDRHDRACELVLRDEALPLFRLFAAHRESAELREEDVESAARELERVEKERAASVDDADTDPVKATREAMARNMRLERANGELAEVDAVADELLLARGKRLH